MYNFGAGRAIVYPAGGGSGIELGTVQNASLELKVEMKELRGAWRYPIAVADGKGTASGKVTFAQLWPETIAAILSGTTTSGQAQGTWPDNTGGITAAIAESSTIPASTPYTVVLANGGTTNGFVAGSEVVSVVIPGYGPVYYVRGGTPTSATAASPISGVYSIATVAGSTTLTFAVGDEGRTVKTTYLFSSSGANAGDQIGVQIAQVGMNTALTFTMMLMGIGRNLYNNSTQQFLVQLNSCLAPSMKIDYKLDDWTMMDVDFSAFVDMSGNLATFYMLGP